MAIEVFILMLSTGAAPAWLDHLPTCHHQLTKTARDERHPSAAELIEALETTALAPMQILRAIEHLSARHTQEHEAAEIVTALRRIAETPELVRVRFAFGEEVDPKEAAAHQTWVRQRIQKVAADALASHGRALTDVILADWARGRDAVLARRAERALGAGGRR